LLIAGTAAFLPYDDEGDFPERPGLCPTAAWTAAPTDFNVPKWAATGTVKFTVTTLTYSNQFTTVIGKGWFVPSPATTTAEGVNWQWQNDDHTKPPAVYASCYEWKILGVLIQSVVPTGSIQGHAFPKSYVDEEEVVPVYPEGGGGGNDDGGGNSGKLECWALVWHGFDMNGQEISIVLSTWCETVYH
jgi:hypothetical protein